MCVCVCLEGGRASTFLIAAGAGATRFFPPACGGTLRSQQICSPPNGRPALQRQVALIPLAVFRCAACCYCTAVSAIRCLPEVPRLEVSPRIINHPALAVLNDYHRICLRLLKGAVHCLASLLGGAMPEGAGGKRGSGRTILNSCRSALTPLRERGQCGPA